MPPIHLNQVLILTSIIVVVEHVSQDVLGVLQSLSHLSIVALQGMIERERLSFSLLVHVSD